jgi:general secretion pathway protein L
MKEIGAASLGAAFRWWIAELRGAFVDALPAAFFRRRLVIVAADAGWTLTRDGAKGPVEIGRLDWNEDAAPSLPRRLRREHAVLSLPESAALKRRLRLPEAAAAELDGVLGFEVPRHTPFSADRVYRCHRIISRQAGWGNGTGALDVELTVVPRDLVDRELERARSLGIDVAEIVVGSPAPRLRGEASILPSRRRTMWTPLNRVLLGVAAVAALACAASPFLAEHARLAEIERELMALRPAADAALAAREQAADAARMIASIAAQKRAVPASVALLEALSRALPDDTYLTSLQLSGRDLTIEGWSAAATRLAAPLEAEFARVDWRAPLARDAESGLEHFQFNLVPARK